MQLQKCYYLSFFLIRTFRFRFLERNVWLLVILRLAINRKELKYFTLYYADKQKVRKAFY